MSQLSPFIPANDVASTLADVGVQLKTATAAQIPDLMREIKACEQTLAYTQVPAKYRVMARVSDGYGGHSYATAGPLRKSLKAAVDRAEQLGGYVVSWADGAVVHYSEAYLSASRRTFTPSSRKDHQFAQVFRI